MNEIIAQTPPKSKLGFDSTFFYPTKDTVIVNFSGNYNLEIPDKKIRVDIPDKDWFDYSIGIITTVGAIIAAVYTLYSIRKLFQRDEQKNLQIDRLTNIVEKLESANNQSLRREKLSKRPHINLTAQALRTNIAGGNIIIDILNSNPISNITSYSLLDYGNLGFSNHITLTVGNNGNVQNMGVQFNYMGIPPAGGVFSIVYITEEGFEYIQEAYIGFDATRQAYEIRGLQILLRDNAIG